MERPAVGVGVIIEKDGRILLGERLASHGAGTWAIPGGHVEGGESFEETALREIEEETGLKDIRIEKLIYVGSNKVYDKHFVSIGMYAAWVLGEAIIMEPDKTGEWKWFSPSELPENIFLPSKFVIDAWLSGQIYTAE